MVNQHASAGNVAGARAEQEQDGASDLFGQSHALLRVDLLDHLRDVRVEGEVKVHHGRRNPRRTERIDANLFLRVLQGRRARDSQNRMLGCHVRRFAGFRDVRVCRRQIDDGAAADFAVAAAAAGGCDVVFFHRGDQRAGYQQGAFDVHVPDVEVLVFEGV